MIVEEWLGKDNKLGIDIWNRKYRDGNETFDEWLDRVSGGDEDVRRLIVEKKMLFGGRTLTNRGTNSRGSMSNCYSEGFVDDSVDDIMKTVTNIALTFKSQGGEGISLSKLRPKGCGVNDGRYESDGIVPFMELFNQTTESISQGGCIAEDQLVQTNNGYRKIKDIKIGDLVWTKKGFVKVVELFDKGNQQVYEVTTNKGYKIETTIDHKFSIDGFNTKHLSELNIGDKINIISGYCNKNFEFISYAYLVGAFLANGYINNNTKNNGNISISKNHKDIAEKIAWCINDIGFDTKISDCDNVYRIPLNKQICDYMLYTLNIHKNGADDIEIPEYIMCGDDSVVISFLAGALDNDGTIRKTSFKYSTVCEKYAHQLMKLFSRVGYFPSLHISIRDNKLPLYDITDSFRRNQPMIPSIKIQKNNISYVKNSKYSTPYTMNNTGISKNNSKHLDKISRNSHIGLYTYLQSDVVPFTPMIYDTIKSIVPTRVCHVYDIGLEYEHLFNCNGFYVSNSRKGALIMTLDAWHKESEDFIKIKSEQGRIQKANLSLEIDDEFMECVKKYYDTGEVITKHISRDYEGNHVEYDITPIKLYKLMMEKAWDWAEPGCLFINRFRNYNLMEFCDDYNIETCNPCGEQSLSPHSACNLCSINLSEFVKDPFDKTSRFDVEDFSNTIDITVKAMDQIIDENKDRHALPEQREKVMNYRNIGIGIMGMYDMFCKLNITYGSKESIELMDAIMGFMFRRAVIASSHLAKEKGTFPMYSNNLLKSTIIKKHFTDEELHLLEIDKYGLRNCSLLSVAPTGTIGTILNISTGCEPAFQISYKRKTESLNGKDTYYDVYIDIAKQYMNKFNTKKLPHTFTTAGEIPWKSRVDMQAVLQNHVDTAISSTVNLPNSCTLEEIEQLYLYAWEKGLKGITIFRDGCKRAGILTTDKPTDKSDKNKNNESELQNNNSKENNSKEDDNINHNIPSQLERGMIIKADNNGVGKIRILQTGCGTLHCCAYFDPIDGELIHTYLSKGSHGGCVGLLTGLSRMISISARGGIDIHTIIDQLFSVGACPAYVSRRVKCGDTSKGSNCPSAVGYALLDMYDEMQHEICDDINESLSKIETKENQKSNISSNNKTPKIAKPKCPECGEELFFEGGCMTCKSCGYSKCD